VKLTVLDLRTFAAIVDLGGISAAARKLGLQKSSVSRDLAALEARLGARLFQRTTRHISLTEAGEVLSAYAHRVVEELENAEAAVSALHRAGTLPSLPLTPSCAISSHHIWQRSMRVFPTCACRWFQRSATST
jgi:DNA-binding transcriptional LysR family regulator